MSLTAKERKAIETQRAGLAYVWSPEGIEHFGEQALVVDALRGLAVRRTRYATEADETAEHYRTHFSNEEMHARFTRLAVDYRKQAAWYTELASKVESRGLPAGGVS